MIDSYINLLPDNIVFIDISHKNLDFIPDLSRFKNLKKIDCSYNKIKNLPILNDNL